MPAELGRMEESFQGTSGKTIFFIQDAHDSLEAQENIAKLIDVFVKKQGVKTVFEEGYEGPVPTDKFFGFIKDPKIKQKVSYFLLDKLRLGGAEYAHVNRTQDFKLIGIDSLKLYAENIKAYQDSSRNRKETESDLNELFNHISILAKQYFPKELKHWLRLKARVSEDKLPLFDYLKELRSLYLKTGTDRSLESYPALTILLAAETSRDKKLIEQLNTLDSKVVFEEMNQLEKRLSTAFLQNDRDRKIFDYYQSLSLLKRLNQIQLTQSEYEAAKEALEHLKTRELADFIVSLTHQSLVLSKEWERHIHDALKFYELAQSRDQSMAGYLEEFIQHSKEDTAVLVFGGFHASAIKKLFKQLGLSYLVISPRITADDKRHQEYYQKLMTLGHHPFEAPFLASRANKPPSIYFAVGAPDREIAVRTKLRAIVSAAAELGNQADSQLLEHHIVSKKRRHSEIQDDANADGDKPKAVAEQGSAVTAFLSAGAARLKWLFYYFLRNDWPMIFKILIPQDALLVNLISPTYIDKFQDPQGINTVAAYVGNKNPTIKISTLDMYALYEKDKKEGEEFWNQLCDVVVNQIIAIKPKIVGFSLKWGSVAILDKIMSKLSEKMGKDLPLIVLGNTGPTFAYHEFLERYKNYGSVIAVVGEGEVAFEAITALAQKHQDYRNLELYKDIFNVTVPGGGEPKVSALALKDYPKADEVQALELLEGGTGIETSRGCPWGACKFCSLRGLYGMGQGKWRPFPLDKVFHRMEQFLKKGERSFYIIDSEFMGSVTTDKDFDATMKRAWEFAETIIALDEKYKDPKKGPIQITVLSVRVDNVIADPAKPKRQQRIDEVFRKLKEAGLKRIYLGIESGDPDQFMRYAKGPVQDAQKHPIDNVERNRQAIEKVRELGFDLEVGFIFTDPEASIKTLKNNIRFIEETRLYETESRLFGPLRVQAGSAFVLSLKNKGLLGAQLDLENLSYPSKYVDPKVGEIESIYLEWEKGSYGFMKYLRRAKPIYDEKLPEEERKKQVNAIQEMLLQGRGIDFRFMKEMVAIYPEDGSAPGIAENAELREHVQNIVKKFADEREELFSQIQEAFNARSFEDDLGLFSEKLKAAWQENLDFSERGIQNAIEHAVHKQNEINESDPNRSEMREDKEKTEKHFQALDERINRDGFWQVAPKDRWEYVKMLQGGQEEFLRSSKFLSEKFWSKWKMAFPNSPAKGSFSQISRILLAYLLEDVKQTPEVNRLAFWEGSPRLLLVGPFENKELKVGSYLAPPLGIYRIANYLRLFGVRVDIYDPNLNPAEGLIKLVRQHRYNIIGMSTYEPTIDNDIQLAQRIREASPDSIFVAGGEAAQYSASKLLGRGNSFHMVVRGFGEFPLLDMVEAFHEKGRQLLMSPDVIKSIHGIFWQGNSGQVFSTQPFMQLGEIDYRVLSLFFDTSIVPYEEYWRTMETLFQTDRMPSDVKTIRTVRLITTSHCGRGCTFCSSTNFLDDAYAKDATSSKTGNAHPIRLLKAEEIIQLLKNIRKYHPKTKTIFFNDDDFLISPQRVMRLTDAIQKEYDAGGFNGERFDFIALGRIDKVNPELLKKMRDVGFSQINYGIEHFSDRVLKDMHKNVTSEEAVRGLNWTLEAGIGALINLIPFYPTATVEDIVRTLDITVDFINKGAGVSYCAVCSSVPRREDCNNGI